MFADARCSFCDVCIVEGFKYIFFVIFFHSLQNNVYEKKPTKLLYLFMSLSDMVDVADKLVYFQTMINHFWRMKFDKRRDGDERFREGKERKYKEWEREVSDSEKENMEKVEGRREGEQGINSDKGERRGWGHFRRQQPRLRRQTDGSTDLLLSLSLGRFFLPFVLQSVLCWMGKK